MPELRKRPAPKETATPAPTAKRSASRPRAAPASTAKAKSSSTTTSKVKKVAAQVKDAVVGTSAEESGAKPVDEVSTVGEIPETVGVGTSGADVGAVGADEGEKSDSVAVAEGGKSAGPLGQESVGKKIDLTDFGGVVKTHAGDDVTLAELLGGSEKGVVLFTYPKASTPGCTTQACLFRDAYAPLQTAGLSVFGLSTDSPKANTTFATKQKLPFDLLCDPDAGLTGALGLKKSVGKGTLRGSVVISKEGVVEVWNQAGPAKTLEAVTAWVDERK